jgi:hypothetical protein
MPARPRMAQIMAQEIFDANLYPTDMFVAFVVVT